MSSITSAIGADQPPLAAWQRCVAAILEVLGAFRAGQLVATLLIVGSGVPVDKPLALLDTGPEVNLLAFSRNLALVLGFQHVGLLLPAMQIGWWHRPLPAYDLTTAGRPLRLVVAVVTVANHGSLTWQPTLRGRVA